MKTIQALKTIDHFKHGTLNKNTRVFDKTTCRVESMGLEDFIQAWLKLNKVRCDAEYRREESENFIVISLNRIGYEKRLTIDKGGIKDE